MSRPSSWSLSSLLLACSLALIGCVAAAPTATTPSPATPAKPVTVVTTCKVDADCTVKNVGNCCGAFPACVNVNSPSDPAGVMAQCQSSGMMSVCGFQEISGCQCVSGQCTAK